MTIAQIRGGDVRVALRLRREGVERAVERGGVELALAAATYGLILLGAGWLGEGNRVPESGRLDDQRLARGTAARHRPLCARHRSRVSRRGAGDGRRRRYPSRSDALWRARLLSLRAREQLTAGDAPAAVVAYGAALDAANLAADRELQAVINNNLAGTLVEVGDLDGSEACLAAAEGSLSATSPIRPSVFGTRAELALARGNLAAAREWLDKSEALKKQTGAEGGIGWTLATRARLEAAAGNQPEAKRLLEQGRHQLQDLGALIAWRSAAAAIGEPEVGISLAAPAPDPLRDRALAMVRVLPYWVAELQRGLPIAIALGMGFAIFWIAIRLDDRIHGDRLGLFVINLLLVALLAGWVVNARRRR